MLPGVVSSIIGSCPKEKMFDGDVFILASQYLLSIYRADGFPPPKDRSFGRE